MRSSRLLSILMLLQTRGRLTAEALAEEFEVSVRTIYRDIDALSLSGAPVYADRGPGGGFALLDGYRTRLTGLTDAEAETLFLGGLAGPAAQLGLSEAMGVAQLKLLAALPAERQAAAERISSRFHLDPVGWYRDAEEAARLPALAQAVWTCRRIAVRYDSWKGVVERSLSPLGLILKGGTWYLAALAESAEPRVYRASNIQALTVSDETFERPADFDLEIFWTASTQRFEAEIFTGEARLRITRAGLKRLSYLGAAQAKVAADALATLDGETCEVVVPIESVDHAAQDFLRLGVEAEVLAPSALRSRMTETAAALAALYGA
ncbi:helix-turn-helix transcriptional regulator [Caulobacter soli]|uniref:helix-turn-helix transcriptional regulator n=1 Tax=Caulobacter soli TaxID=2708539 RepID=UPI0013E9AE5A|nr:YafY family protein [Caulobacter soli]